MALIYIRINNIRHSVDLSERSELSYEDIIKITKMPHGVSVVYLHTKGVFKAGYLWPRDKIALVDGLDISAMTVVET